MMPDLGKYAEAVLSSYAASLFLLAILVLMTIRSGRKARRALEDVENQQSPAFDLATFIVDAGKPGFRRI